MPLPQRRFARRASTAASFFAEDHPPYERPPLSKEYLRGEEQLDETLVRPLDWYGENGVELRTGTRVV